ncbi:MAG: T9SS type A sorting domain-containing protein [Bacteroidetes bacterium]|nr:T9SS type A sorting domain-containing protein [Bacteroidota bacterium]
MLTYTWREGTTIIAGPTLIIDMAMVTLPKGVRTITLEVDDGNVGTLNDTDVVVITVVDTTPPDVIATLDTALGSGNGCSECKGGVVVLTLAYNGPGSNVVVVVEAGSKETYTISSVNTGDTFTILGTGKGGKFKKNDLDIFVDGTQVGSLHVSCSDEIGPGTTDETQVKGVSRFSDGETDFTVFEAISKDGGLVCPTDTNGEGDFIAMCDVTDTCDGDPTITVIILVPTLSPATIEFKVKNKKKLKFELAMDKLKVEAPDPAAFWAQVLADGGIKVSNGRRFDIDEKPGSDKFEYKFDNAGNLKKVKGPEVTLKCTATDAAGNMAMDEAGPDFPCDECKGGVVQLTLQYNGAAATILVQDSEDIYFNAMVAAGGQFTINGTKSDGKFQKNNLDFFVNTAPNTNIHVSCSQPINPGLVFGAFTIIEAISKGGGEVCPLVTPNLLLSGLSFLNDGVVLPAEPESSDPKAFALEANYPNPFNPETRIAFTLPETGPVKLVVYDVVGRKVDTLIDGVLSAGQHEITWHVGTLPSGVYLYRITAGTYEQVRQMTVLK